MVNGETVGKAGAGEDNTFKAIFETQYSRGEIVAVAYTDGVETGRTTLRSAGREVNLKVEVDRAQISADGNDLAFVTISIVDDQGVVKPLADREVTVKVEGAGILQGFGSANPKTDEDYVDNVHKTFDGKAHAVIRPTHSGTIHVRIEAEECTAQIVTIEAVLP